VNWEHEGSGHICGVTIDAEIDKDKIITTNIFYKSLFPDKFEELKEKIKSGEAAVSFEIWSIDPETKKSLIKVLEDGTKEFTKIVIHGTGLLLVNPPAEPSARVFSLVAKNLVTEAEQIVNNIFERDLVYASLAIENNEKEDKVMDEVKKTEETAYECECLKCGKVISSEQHCKDTKCPECGGEMRRKDRPGTGKGEEEKAEEKLPEETKTEVKAEETKTAEATEKVAEPVAETKSEETKVEETKEAPKAEAEAKVEEPKVEEKAEKKKEAAQPLEVIEPKIVVKITSEYREVRVSTFADDGTPSGAEEVKGYTKQVTEYKDGTKDEVSEEVEVKRKYDFAELEAEVNKVKTEKDAEIASLKTATDELDKEIKNLKDELGKKDQEIAELKTPKAEEKKEKEMTVGAVEIETKSEIKKQADKINEIIANKGK
jgi:DNA-directed RNA polymerase subunit RPC12/RpoP